MATPELYPIPFPTLVDRLDRELMGGGALYTIKRKDWWTPDPARDVSFEHLGRRLATPSGPASGPQTQLAQNLVVSWLTGGRFLELKTVQVLDELELPRPCIHVPHVGYNVEWSQELRVPQSAVEYVKGWWLVHMLASDQGPGLWPGVDAIFDISLGYDLAGIRTDKVQRFLATIRDCQSVVDALRDTLPPRLARWAAVPCPARLSDSVTLSTFHGCPADEIESIANETLESGLHTVVKLNPTLHGFAGARQILDHAGYDFIELSPTSFNKDLRWEQLMEMVPRLQARARALGLCFGVKFSNTLVCWSEETPFFPNQPEAAKPGEAAGAGHPEMYLSGPPLHLLAFTLAARFRRATEHLGHIPITFSAGIDEDCFAPTVGAGLGPVTSCSDLLKGKGYARQTAYLRKLEGDMEAQGCADLDAYRAALGQDYLDVRAREILDDSRLHRAANQRAPRKVASALELLDCLTCDKCIPVCPNLANFTIPVETGRWRPGRVHWTGGSFEISEGVELIAEKRHQIGNVADACNLCGQCDTWCPESGGPFLVKPSVFLDAAIFEDHPERDGFHLSPDRRRITWRRGRDRFTLVATDDGHRLETNTGSLDLVDDRPVASAGHGEVDLSVATTLRLFLRAFANQGAEAWLEPIG